MGSYACVNIPEDLECGMIETSAHSVAWCIVEMCSPWMDGSISEEDFKCIPSAAAKTADREVPQTLEGYNAWRRLRIAEPLANQPGSGKLWSMERVNWKQYPFEEARAFLRTYGASTSTDDIDFTI
jgi:hypothetical protein